MSQQSSVTVTSFPPNPIPNARFLCFNSYNFHIGNVNVDYSAESCVLDLPGDGQRLFNITGASQTQS